MERAVNQESCPKHVRPFRVDCVYFGAALTALTLCLLILR